MLRRLRLFLLVLIAFAVVGGTSTQLAQLAPMTMAGMPCSMAMPDADAGHGAPLAPCKGMTADCIKQMCCATVVALPARFVTIEVADHFSDVDYWSAWSKLANFVREPEPLPPRTA
jgi:hypothetical protein